MPEHDALRMVGDIIVMTGADGQELSLEHANMPNAGPSHQEKAEKLCLTSQGERFVHFVMFLCLAKHMSEDLKST
jgi:hypothetical protein